LVLLGTGTPTTDAPWGVSTSTNRCCWFDLKTTPAAVHRVTTGHEIDTREPPVAPTGFLLGASDQLVPFQRSASVPWSDEPTARHAVADGHAIAASSLSDEFGGSGLVTIDHDTPSQRSASVLLLVSVCDDPTARHSVLLAHAAPTSPLSNASATLGLGTIFQLAPSHRSISVVCPPMVPVSTKYEPTAKQLVVLEHASPDSTLTAESGFGVGSNDHRLELHRNTSVLVTVEVLYCPTAMQNALLEHFTAARLLERAPDGVGLSCATHFWPFHR